jgi:hypothetical protein
MQITFSGSDLAKLIEARAQQIQTDAAADLEAAQRAERAQQAAFDADPPIMLLGEGPPDEATAAASAAARTASVSADRERRYGSFTTSIDRQVGWMRTVAERIAKMPEVAVTLDALIKLNLWPFGSSPTPGGQIRALL